MSAPIHLDGPYRPRSRVRRIAGLVLRVAGVAVGAVCVAAGALSLVLLNAVSGASSK